MSKWLSLKLFEWAIGVVVLMACTMVVVLILLAIWASTFLTVQIALRIIALVVLPAVVGKVFINRIEGKP